MHETVVFLDVKILRIWEGFRVDILNLNLALLGAQLSAGIQMALDKADKWRFFWVGELLLVAKLDSSPCCFDQSVDFYPAC